MEISTKDVDKAVKKLTSSLKIGQKKYRESGIENRKAYREALKAIEGVDAATKNVAKTTKGIKPPVEKTEEWVGITKKAQALHEKILDAQFAEVTALEAQRKIWVAKFRDADGVLRKVKGLTKEQATQLLDAVKMARVHEVQQKALI